MAVLAQDPALAPPSLVRQASDARVVRDSGQDAQEQASPPVMIPPSSSLTGWLGASAKREPRMIESAVRAHGSEGPHGVSPGGSQHDGDHHS